MDLSLEHRASVIMSIGPFTAPMATNNRYYSQLDTKLERKHGTPNFEKNFHDHETASSLQQYVQVVVVML